MFSIRLSTGIIFMLICFVPLCLNLSDNNDMRFSVRTPESHYDKAMLVNEPFKSSNRSGQEGEIYANDQYADSLSIINEEIDIALPLVIQHLQELGLEFFQLPDITENISVKLIVLTYDVVLNLTNGIVYNLSGIRRIKEATMTLKDKAFICRFYFIISKLNFEYNFVLTTKPVKGFGKLMGVMDNTVFYAEIAINIKTLSFHLNEFRIIDFNDIHVQLDAAQLINPLTDMILSPIANVFKNHIIYAIDDRLKGQIQAILDNFSYKDVMGLRKFKENILARVKV